MSRRTLAALLMAVGLLVASCGSSGGSSEQSSSETDSADASSQDDSGGGDGSATDVAGFFTGACTEAVQAYSAAIASAGSGFTPGGADATPADTVDLLDEVADQAPDEISGDFETLATAYGDYATALADAGVDFNDPQSFQDPETLAALQGLGEAFDTEAMTQASDNINAWFEANCNAG